MRPCTAIRDQILVVFRHTAATDWCAGRRAPGRAAISLRLINFDATVDPIDRDADRECVSVRKRAHASALLVKDRAFSRSIAPS